MMVTFLEVDYVTDIMYVQGAQSRSPKLKNTILNTHSVLKSYCQLKVFHVKTGYHLSMNKSIKDR